MVKRLLERFFERPRPNSVTPQSSYTNYAPGDRIGGKFLVERVLQGGLGRVFVVSEGADPPFILKTLKPGVGDITAFMQEARTWIRLGRHPHIVPAFWADTVAGMPCVAAEYITPDEMGRVTLRDHLRLGPAPLHRVLRWAAQFCYAMQHAVDRGLIAHRDIKPENLLIDRDGSLQVTDFGLAASKTLEWPQGEEVQVAGGTPYYMAPEQWRGERQDFRTDAYAFGIVLFEAAFGHFPWQCSTLREIRDAHLSGYVPIPPKHPLIPLIGPATMAEPEDRLATPAEMLIMVQTCADLVGVALPPPPPRLPDQQHLELYARSFLSATRNAEHAIAAAQELTTRYGHFVPGWVQLGLLHYQQGELRAAGFATQEALDRDQYNSAAWNNMGLIMNKAGHSGEAAKLLVRAIDCDPGNSGAMTNLAAVLVELGRSAEGLQWAEKAAEISPDKLSVWLPLGSLYANSGQARKAQHAFERALECVPSDRRAVLRAQIVSVFRKFAHQ